MAYGTITDVRGWLPQWQAIDDQAMNPPSSTTVTGWLSDLTGMLDATFGATTDADYLLSRKVLLAREVAYQVMAVRAASKDEKAPALFLGWHDDWEALFDDPDAASAIIGSGGSDAGIASSYTMNADDDPDSSVNPVFQRDQAHNW